MANLLALRSTPITSSQDHTDEERKLLERVRKDKTYAEKARKPYETRWNEWYGLHRNYRRFVEARRAVREPDRDEVINEAKREFGAELFIPYIFATVETMLPRLLMNNPRMRVKPKRRHLQRDRAEAVRMMFEERQREIDYVLKLVPVARSGLMYGLGITKNFWDRKESSTLVLEQNNLRARVAGPYVRKANEVNEGPMTEDVDVLNFFWDPAAKDIETSRFVIHRTWRDLNYIRERVEKREWAPVDIEAVKKMSPDTNRESVFKDRQMASGLTDLEDSGDTRMHEVWEWHNGTQMATVLDGQLLVQYGENPFAHGQLPFSIWRPTLQQTEFVGIGEIEPIVSLQYELNALRSMRLDNAMLVMQKAFIYAEGLVDPADLIVGPGRGIPVEGGSINDAIQPINFGELPAASYRETEEIKSDIELASAISETTAGGSGANNASAETATGIQIVQAAANTRVEMKTKMLSHELVTRDTGQWLEMYRQHTLMQPREVAIDAPGGYQWIEVHGQDLDLVESVLPEEDSMAPENTPQKRNDALALNNQLQGFEFIDKRKQAAYLLDAFDVPDGESWIVQKTGEDMLQEAAHQFVSQGSDEQDVLAATQQFLMAASGQDPTTNQQHVRESISINYKDAPPDIQRQMEAEAGFEPSKMGDLQAAVMAAQAAAKNQPKEKQPTSNGDSPGGK